LWGTARRRQRLSLPELRREVGVVSAEDLGSVMLADRLAAAILEHGPMAECHLATTVQKRKCEVSAVLEADDRFVHNGLKARASRWDLRAPVAPPDQAGDGEVVWPEGFEKAEEALIRLVRTRQYAPEEALIRIVVAWAVAA
jgi:hypothetical protein